MNQPKYLLLAFVCFPLIFLLLERQKTPPAVTEQVTAPTPKAISSALPNLQNSRDLAAKNPNFDTYFQLGYDYYLHKQYPEAIDATLKALQFNMNSDKAWNNLCSMYNEIHDWDKAIVAGNKAVQLNPSFELAKNNLNWAKKQQEKVGTK